MRESDPGRGISGKKTSLGKEAMDLHKKLRGKIEIKSKIAIKTTHDISIVYTPGVADVCRAIAADREKAYEYTSKWNNIAIVTDGDNNSSQSLDYACSNMVTSIMASACSGCCIAASFSAFVLANAVR